MLNGGGIRSGSGNICAEHEASGELMNFDYGYDVQRDSGLTFHDRSNVQNC